MFVGCNGFKTVMRISSIAFKLSKRHLSVKQTAVALRPLYFSVHPDFFGKYPQERSVNEESLKTLHEYITSQRKIDNVRPAKVVFYIRPRYTNSKGLTEVKFNLSTKNVRSTVVTVLQRCGLSLNYVNTVSQDSTKDGSFPRPIKWHQSYYAATGKTPPEETFKQPDITLRSWLRKNINIIRQSEQSSAAIQDDIKILQQQLITDVHLVDLRWRSLWGFTHFRGCLKSFHQLYKDHPVYVKQSLKGRILVFGNNTGVSLHGDVVLSGEDVRTAWLKLLRSVSAYDAVLERLPLMENKLSELLNNIQIVRRKHHHHIVMADEYELLLNKLMNTLRKGQDVTQKWLGDETLSDIEIVVEGESGPLALSNTGQFLIPASVPVMLIVEFIAKNKEQASLILKENSSNKITKGDEKMITRLILGDEHIYRRLMLGKEHDAYKIDVGFMFCEDKAIEECKQHMELREITKDENITPQQMITCCEKLVTEYWKLGVLLTNTRLNICNYYSVIEDGKICIPWNCKMDTG